MQHGRRQRIEAEPGPASVRQSGTTLLIRPAEGGHAAALLDYFEKVGGESDFLTFGPGEFGISLAEEEAVLKKGATRDNELYVVGAVDGRIVGVLTFSAGERPRLRHVGEFGLSILRPSGDSE